VADTTGGGTGSDLPRTGAPLGALTIAAVVFLMIGAAALRIERRA
jgi:hypothetical protein